MGFIIVWVLETVRINGLGVAASRNNCIVCSLNVCFVGSEEGIRRDDLFGDCVTQLFPLDSGSN